MKAGQFIGSNAPVALIPDDRTRDAPHGVEARVKPPFL